MVRVGRTTAKTRAVKLNYPHKHGRDPSKLVTKAHVAAGLRPGEYFEWLVTRLRGQADDYHPVTATLDKYNTGITDLREIRPSELPVKTISNFLKGPLRDTWEQIYPSLPKLSDCNGSIYSVYKPPYVVKREKRRDRDKKAIKEEIRNNIWRNVLETHANEILKECPFVTRVYPVMLDLPDASDCPDQCHVLAVQYLHDNQLKSALVPLALFIGQFPRNEHYWTMVTDEWGWFHPWWREQKTGRVETSMAKIRQLYFLQVHDAVRRLKRKAGEQAWVHANTLHAGLDVTIADRYLSPGEHQVVNGASSFSSLAQAMYFVLCNSPTVHYSDPDINTEGESTTTSYFPPQPWALINLECIHLDPPTRPTSMVSTIGTELGLTEVLDGKALDDEGSLDTTSSSSDDADQQEDANLEYDQGLRRTSILRLSLFETRHQLVVAANTEADRRGFWRPFTTRDHEGLRRFNEEFLKAKKNKAVKKKWTEFQQDSRPCEGYRDELGLPHRCPRRISQIDVTNIRLYTLHLPINCLKCYRLTDLYRDVAHQVRTHDNRTACAANSYCLNDIFCTRSTGAFCDEHWQVIAGKRKAANETMIARMDLGDLVKQLNQPVRQSGLNQYALDFFRASETSPDRVIFCDTEFGYARTSSNKYLRQVTLIRASDRKVLLNFVSKSVSHLNPVLTVEEDTYLRKQLGRLINPETILVEWSVGWIDWTMIEPYCSSMPPKESTIRLALAWRGLLKKDQTYKLEVLHPLVCPDSPWIYLNHTALADTHQTFEMGEALVERVRAARL